ncbi:hypothetical protein [Microbacterium aurantiacum]|uniref:hypothetical protein n=1 Tax=Microbacterium aurantiacum TaxID=162393 RepID=UPI000C7FB711|nr:hypothetical protein [Microbacterium aurantiacum]
MSALAMTTIAALALTGCTPQSKESAEQYRATIAAVPGVIEVSMTTSTPLPFTVQVGVVAVVPAEEEVLDELVRVACAEKPNASVQFTVVVRVDDDEVQTSAGSACPLIERDVIGIATAISTLGLSGGANVQVRSLSDGGARVEISMTTDDGRVYETLAVAETVAQRLEAEERLALSARGLRLPTEDPATVAQRIADLRAVDALFPLESVVYEETGVVATLAADQGDPKVAVVTAGTLLRASPSGLWRDVDVAIVPPGGGSANGAGPAGVRLVSWIDRELGLEATGSNGVVHVQVGEIGELVAASEQISANNPEGLDVAFTMQASGTKPAFRVDSSDRVALDASSNPYPRWAEWWQSFADTGMVDIVEVGHEGLSVWLHQDVYDDQDKIERVDRIASQIAEDAGLEWYRVNNRYTEL